jgi:hypothetical protein
VELVPSIGEPESHPAPGQRYRSLCSAALPSVGRYDRSRGRAFWIAHLTLFGVASLMTAGFDSETRSSWRVIVVLLFASIIGRFSPAGLVTWNL